MFDGIIEFFQTVWLYICFFFKCFSSVACCVLVIIYGATKSKKVIGYVYIIIILTIVVACIQGVI